MTGLDKIYAASKLLFNNMPFYGILSLRVRKVVDENVKTACIRLGSDNFSMEMAFNPEWIKDMSIEHVRGVVEHELSHMINGHLTDPIYTSEHINHELMNIAMDCEINQYINSKYLPEGITLKKVEQVVGTSIPEKAGTMTYYNLLKKKSDENKIQIGIGQVSGNGSTISTMDQHTIITNQSTADAVIEGIVESAANETVKRRGTLPGVVEQMLKLAQEKRQPVIDWKSFLRRFVQNSYKEHTITTRRRESRRFEGAPGLRHEPEFQLLVAIDSSGSVSNAELTEFMQEIDNIHRNKCDIRILVCDTRIVQDFEYKGNKEQIEIKGRGGTSFEPVLDVYEKTPSTCLVYFTDGECPVERRLKKPVLWILSSRGTDSYLKDCKTVKMNKK